MKTGGFDNDDAQLPFQPIGWWAVCQCPEHEIMPVFAAHGKRVYIHGHNSIKDMSERKCSICGSDKTYQYRSISKSGLKDRPKWFMTNGIPICNNCYQRTISTKRENIKQYIKKYRRQYYQRHSQEIKERVKQYRQRPEVKERRKEQSRQEYRQRIEYYKQYIQRPEVKERQRKYMKQYRQRARELYRKKHNVSSEKYRV